MLNRDFYNAVIDANLSDEMTAKAQSLLSALDNRNGKRADKEKEKREKENAPIVSAIVEYLGEHTNTDSLASAVATACGVSTAKASALLRGLVAEEKATVTDVKVKGKGTQKGYRLVVAE